MNHLVISIDAILPGSRQQLGSVTLYLLGKRYEMKVGDTLTIPLADRFTPMPGVVMSEAESRAAIEKLLTAPSLAEELQRRLDADAKPGRIVSMEPIGRWWERMTSRWRRG